MVGCLRLRDAVRDPDEEVQPVSGPGELRSSPGNDPAPPELAATLGAKDMVEFLAGMLCGRTRRAAQLKAARGREQATQHAMAALQEAHEARERETQQEVVAL